MCVFSLSILKNRLQVTFLSKKTQNYEFTSVKSDFTSVKSTITSVKSNFTSVKMTC